MSKSLYGKSLELFSGLLLQPHLPALLPRLCPRVDRVPLFGVLLRGDFEHGLVETEHDELCVPALAIIPDKRGRFEGWFAGRGSPVVVTVRATLGGQGR